MGWKLGSQDGFFPLDLLNRTMGRESVLGNQKVEVSGHHHIPGLQTRRIIMAEAWSGLEFGCTSDEEMKGWFTR
jgi:hypothetical protein